MRVGSCYHVASVIHLFVLCLCGPSARSASLSCERHTTGFSYGSLASSADNAQAASYRTPRPLRRHNARESVETTIRKRRLLFAGAVQRKHNERLTRRVTFGTMAGGENPGPGRPEKNWAQCLADLRVFRATEGCTDSVPFGVWCRNGAMAHGG